MLKCACNALFRRSVTTEYNASKILSSGFKSKISLDNLYPKNDQPFKGEKHSSPKSDEFFSGMIPLKELSIQCNRSSGPGGQNVNKVNTKVEIRFHIDSATWIPEWIKPKLKEQQENRINKNGELIVVSEKTRKQILNQADCLDKLRQMIFTAAIKPKEITPEQIELQKKREEKANMLRIQEKRRRSMLKSMRRGEF
ncbi:Peptidyl-tRNA hydrolase ict1 [Mactra antiquata]